MATVDLGLIYGLGVIGFAIIYGTSKGFVWKTFGRYGFVFMLILAIFQVNIDAAAGAPMSMGLALFLLVAFLILSLVIDTLFIIMVVLPMRKNRKPWNEILFGGE